MNEKKSLGGGVESSHAQKIQSPGLDLMNEVYKDLLQVKSLEGSVEEDFRDLIKVLVEGAGSLEAHGAAASRLRREVGRSRGTCGICWPTSPVPSATAAAWVPSGGARGGAGRAAAAGVRGASWWR
ncbi:unnamed protein product, partial [Heterosigma akashiwo]